MLVGGVPAQRRTAERELKRLLDRLRREEVQIGRDLDVGLVSVGDNPLVSRIGRRSYLLDAGESAYLRNVGLADAGAAVVHHLDELANVGESQVAYSGEKAVTAHLQVTLHIVQRQGSLEKPDANLVKNRKQAQPLCRGAIRERRIHD